MHHYGAVRLGTAATIFKALLAASAACAAPHFHPMFGDHAVIQRGRPVILRGTADAHEVVTITLGPQRKEVQADADGRFTAQFDPVSRTGPINLSAQGPSGRIVAQDIVMGDVFLCSGQSNMEMEVRYAQDAMGQSRESTDSQLRLMTVPRRVADVPQADFADPPHWRPADPESVPGFSATCYYMVRELRRSARVPVGAIASSWGGSQISPWMGAPAQIAVGRSDRAALLARHALDPFDGERAASAQWEAWWRRATGDRAGHEPWQSASPLTWLDVPAIGPWEAWGVPGLTDYNGMVWFRREFDLTVEQARGSATLSLGTLDDVGRVWINGAPVGMSARAWQPSSFAVPPAVLKAGRNVLIVNVLDGYANGGMEGPANAMALQWADGGRVPLADGWRYAVAHRSPPGVPQVPWSDLAGAGTLYNGMIAPLGPVGLKGVAWYQGESDTDLPGYADRLAAMMADWRRQFGAPDLGFAIVQLAAFGKPATAPGESGWAILRADQARAVAADKYAGLATAIDLGDPFDIHPGEKQELGRRLARAMRAAAYGEMMPLAGPQAAGATATADGGAVVNFTGLTGGLATRSGTQALGFELCGNASGSCRYADARVEGARVILRGDGQSATRVRYGWADYPVVNLYDAAPLPVGPFERTIAPRP